MPDLSALVPETHRDISAGYVETLIQARREELFTGLMRLSYASGDHLVFAFLEGIQQKLYRCLGHHIDVMPKHAWFGVLDQANASVGVLPLTVEAMRFTRLAYETPVLHTEKSTFTRGDLLSAARKWADSPEPSVVHMRSEGANRYYLIAGHSTPIIEELSFTDGSAHFAIGDASFPERLPGPGYEVVRYVSNCDHNMWREHELRLAFTPLMRMLLSRFSELAGRVLTERLCEQLSVWTRQGGWNISVTSNGAVNRHYFDSLESAIGVYVELLRRFRAEASPAIGLRLIDMMWRETLIKLDLYHRELLTQYLFSQFGLGSISGVVRR